MYKITFKNGRITHSIHLDFVTNARKLGQNEAFIYLGINEGDIIHHTQMKEKVRKSITGVYDWGEYR